MEFPDEQEIFGRLLRLHYNSEFSKYSSENSPPLISCQGLEERSREVE